MKRIFLTLIILWFCSHLQAQVDIIKWGDIPKEFLQMKSYDADTTAAALILINHGEYAYGNDFNLEKRVHERIKILKPSAFKDATVYINYTDGSEKVSMIKASSFNLNDDGTVEETKFSGNNIATEQIAGSKYRKKFTIPDVKVGSVIEYEYKTVSDHVFILPPWYFQSLYPVLRSELTVSIPFKANYKEEESKEVGISYSMDLKDPTGLIKKTDQTVKDRIRIGNVIVDCDIATHTWVGMNMPAFHEENYITTPEDYFARIDFELQSMVVLNTLPIDVMSTWQRLNNKLSDMYFTTRQINKGPIADVTDSLVRDIKDPQEKVKVIYDYVSSRFSVEDVKSIYPSDDLNKIFRAERGQYADINLVLTLMLIDANIEAFPIITSTWDHGYPQQNYPLPDQFNYLLTVAKVNRQEMILDATSRFRPMGLVPKFIVARPALVVDKARVNWVYIPANAKMQRSVRVIASIDDKGIISGNIDISDEGYAAFLSRSNYNPSESQSQMISLYGLKNDHGMKAAVSQVKNTDDIQAPLITGFTFTMSATDSSRNDHLYFQPQIIHYLEASPFKSDKRDLPVDFGLLYNYNYFSEFTFPESYTVEKLPKNVLVKLPNDDGEVKRFVQVEENKVSVLISMTLNRDHFEPDEYESLRQFFDQLVAANSDQIVLKKK